MEPLCTSGEDDQCSIHCHCRSRPGASQGKCTLLRLHYKSCNMEQLVAKVQLRWPVQQRVKEHSYGEHGHKWEGCQVFKDYHEMLEKTTKDKKPDAIIIGVPPWLHGERKVCGASSCCLRATQGSLMDV